MVQPRNHQRLMAALEEARSEPRLPPRLELARRAGVSPATMNRDVPFLEAYATAAEGATRGSKPRRANGDSETLQRLRQENSQLEAAVQLLAESVQALTLENERLRDDLRRRHGLAPVDDSGPRLGRQPRR